MGRVGGGERELKHTPSCLARIKASRLGEQQLMALFCSNLAPNNSITELRFVCARVHLCLDKFVCYHCTL